MKSFLLSTCTLLLFLLTGCDIVNPEEDLPAFIHIKEFIVETNQEAPFNIGSLSQKITNAQVFIRDDNDPNFASVDIGIVNLPVTLPILIKGNRTVVIDPIIKASGSSFFLRTYPYYERFTIQQEFTEVQVDTIQPLTRYKSAGLMEVQFTEGFENSSHIFQDYRNGPEGTLNPVSDSNVFEGGQSGHVHLTRDQPLVEIGTAEFFEVDFSKEPYLEINYKNDVPIQFGIVGRVGIEEFPVLEFVVVPREDWNKVYIELREAVSFIANSGFDSYQVVFSAGIPIENGDFTLDEADVYLDNFKFINLK